MSTPKRTSSRSSRALRAQAEDGVRCFFAKGIKTLRSNGFSRYLSDFGD